MRLLTAGLPLLLAPPALAKIGQRDEGLGTVRAPGGTHRLPGLAKRS